MGRLEVKDRIQRQLSSWVNGLGIDEDGDYYFDMDSARVWVSVRDWEEMDLTLVKVFSIPLWSVPGSPELFKEIATRASHMRFGTLSLSEREDGAFNVHFHHQLIGDTLDPEELKHAVSAVAYTADHLDDELKETYGGTRWIDHA